jgi:hypothetical protein
MGQITNGMAKGRKTYALKMQSGYGRSDHEQHGKGREDILAENAEHVGSDHERHGRRERTYALKVQSGCDVSVRE